MNQSIEFEQVTINAVYYVVQEMATPGDVYYYVSSLNTTIKPLLRRTLVRFVQQAAIFTSCHKKLGHRSDSNRGVPQSVDEIFDAAQECDASGDAQRTNAGNKKTFHQKMIFTY